MSSSVGIFRQSTQKSLTIHYLHLNDCYWHYVCLSTRDFDYFLEYLRSGTKYWLRIFVNRGLEYQSLEYVCIAT